MHSSIVTLVALALAATPAIAAQPSAPLRVPPSMESSAPSTSSMTSMPSPSSTASLPGCAGEGAQVRVLLLDLKATPALTDSAKGLGQIVAAEAARVSGFAIVSFEEVRAALDQEANKLMLGCDENSCLAELAQALDASLVVAGSLGETQSGETLVSLTLLNTKAIVVVNRVNMSWAGEARSLPDVVRAAARTLLLEPKQRPPGGLKLVGLPEGARVYIDGRREDGAEHGGLQTGPHEVKVLVDGKLPAVMHVVTAPTDTAAVEVSLVDEPASSSWLAIGATTAILAGGAAALAVAYALGQSDVVVTAAVPSVGVNDVESLGGKR